MTKISFDPEVQEIEITRTIKKTGDGRIVISREGGEVEINIGIAKIGGTTDYGGAITLGVFGQEVTWGREGGTIHLGIGGFNVDVEARDCVVVEIKSIYGNIVAQRSYPDPGCKLPDPPSPTPTPVLTPVPGQGVGVPDTDQVIWVPLRSTRLNYNNRGDVESEEITTPTVTNKETDKARINGRRVPFDLSILVETASYSDFTVFMRKNTLASLDTHFTGGDSDARYHYPTSPAADVTIFKTSRNGVFGGFIDTGKRINKFLNQLRENEARYLSTPRVFFFGNAYSFHHEPIDYVVVGESNPPRFLPTGNKPPMRDCCEEVLEYLADIEEAFEIRRLLEEKFPISNSFMAPECDPAAVTEAKSYYEVTQCVIRMMAHGLIFEPRVEIKDADAAKAGDQEFKTKYLNATGWASAVSEALLEVKDDGNVSTNMDIRNAFAVTQTMVGLTDAIYKLEAIVDCLGIEVIPKVQTVDTPFNLQIQIGKGFGENNERQIDLNTDAATEKLLPVLLQTKKNKIKTIDIHPRSRSILDILENIEANLPGIDNG
jgi:hypothetical protein